MKIYKTIKTDSGKFVHWDGDGFYSDDDGPTIYYENSPEETLETIKDPEFSLITEPVRVVEVVVIEKTELPELDCFARSCKGDACSHVAEFLAKLSEVAR